MCSLIENIQVNLFLHSLTRRFQPSHLITLTPYLYLNEILPFERS